MKFRQLLETAEEKDAELHGHSHEFAKGHRLVPGSAEWLAKKASEKSAKEADAQTTDDTAVALQHKPFEVETLHQKPVVSPWKIISGSWVSSAGDNNDDTLCTLSSDKKTGVIMSSRSIVSASCHGPFPHQASCPELFGVSYSAMNIASNNNNNGNNNNDNNSSSQVAVEGVTLFPQGSDWVRRALYCVGKRLDQGTEAALETSQLPTRGQELSYKVMCEFVRSVVVAGMSHTIEEDGLLIQAIDLLFADYLTPSMEDGLTMEEMRSVANRFAELMRRHSSRNQRGGVRSAPAAVAGKGNAHTDTALISANRTRTKSSGNGNQSKTNGKNDHSRVHKAAKASVQGKAKPVISARVASSPPVNKSKPANKSNTGRKEAKKAPREVRGKKQNK